MKKLLKLVVFGSVLLLAAQGSADAACRRCMVNRGGAVQNVDYGQYETGPQDEQVVCVRQVSDKTVATRKIDKQAGKQANKQMAKLIGTLKEARSHVAVWAQAVSQRMLEARVRLSGWARAKATWMRAKKQAIAAYIKARHKA